MVVNIWFCVIVHTLKLESTRLHYKYGHRNTAKQNVKEHISSSSYILPKLFRNVSELRISALNRERRSCEILI